MRLKVASGIVILALILTVFMAGCTSTQNTSTQSGQSNSQNNNAASISAQAVQSPQQLGTPPVSNSPASGDKFVMYNVTFNANGQSVSVYREYFTVQDTSNNTYPSINFGDVVIGHFPGTTTTNPGMKINGMIVYEVPQNAKLVTMTYDDSAMANIAHRTPLHIVTTI